ncbi:hypothetical protein AX17_001047 [Amanita inopinata Kibby_2008]|nr:hypothetical protein AX17_001047 [Amanita inopinata Kibby_2008]
MMPRQRLLATAQQFCAAFSNKESVQTILSYFSETQDVSAIEHGEPALAPFLGRRFLGLAGIQEYFEMIGHLLSYDNLRFSDFVVDAEASKVVLKGQGKFTWISTEESWEESFAYLLDFDEEGKITQYQVWADSGSAYLARIGELNKIKVGTVHILSIDCH